MNADVSLPDRVETIFLALVVAWGVYVLSEALTFGRLLAWFLPGVSAALMLVFVGVLVWRGEDKPSLLDEEQKSVDQLASRRETLLIVGLILGYLVTAVVIGFFYAMPIYLVVFFWTYDLYPPKRLVIVTLLGWLGVSVLLGVVFNIPGVDFGPFSRIDLGLF